MRSYRTFSPLPSRAEARRGGLFSVALSLGSPPVAVTRHLSLEPGLSSTGAVSQNSSHPAATVRPTDTGPHNGLERGGRQGRVRLAAVDYVLMSDRMPYYCGNRDRQMAKAHRSGYRMAASGPQLSRKPRAISAGQGWQARAHRRDKLPANGFLVAARYLTDGLVDADKIVAELGMTKAALGAVTGVCRRDAAAVLARHGAQDAAAAARHDRDPDARRAVGRRHAAGARLVSRTEHPGPWRPDRRGTGEERTRRSSCAPISTAWPPGATREAAGRRLSRPQSQMVLVAAVGRGRADTRWPLQSRKASRRCTCRLTGRRPSSRRARASLSCLTAPTIVSYDVDCEDIADLISAEGRARHRVSSKAMACAWRLLADAGALVPSWRIAARLIDAGLTGIIVPSFAARSATGGSKNLVLWRWAGRAAAQGDDHRSRAAATA